MRNCLTINIEYHLVHIKVWKSNYDGEMNGRIRQKRTTIFKKFVSADVINLLGNGGLFTNQTTKNRVWIKIISLIFHNISLFLG